MTTLDDFADTNMQCWARFIMESGEWCYIGVAQTSIIIKKSKLGIMGAKIYTESDMSKVAKLCAFLDEKYGHFQQPEGMSSSVLSVFSKTILTCKSLSELAGVLNNYDANPINETSHLTQDTDDKKQNKLVDQIYVKALEETENNEMEKATWAKAFADAQGDQNKAKALYIQKRVIVLKKEIEPDNSDVYFNRAESQSELGLHEDAIENYKRAIEIDPNHLVAYSNLGYSQSELGLHEDAIKSYKRAIEIDPDDSVIYYNLAKSQSELGLHEDAIKSYKRAIEIDPDDSDACHNLAKSQRKLELDEEA